MIKKSFFVLFAASFILSNAIIAHAQKIYLFSEGDIQDPKIGEAVGRDIQTFTSLFFESVPKKQLVIYNQDDLWKGPDIESSSNVKEDIFTAIKKCPAGSSDKIVFYWSGHGAYDKDGHYLIMPKDRGERALYRSEILSALQKKGASLTVLITDSCNIFHEYRGNGAVSGEPPSEDISASPIIQSLFLNCSGVVNINSSSPGEKSYCSPTTGSVFTINFYNCKLFNEDMYLSWKSFLNGVQKTMRKEGSNQTIYVLGDLPSSPLANPSNVARSDYMSSGPSGDWQEYSSGQWHEIGEEQWRDTGPSDPSGQWSEARYHPDNNDRIISVNDIRIQNSAHFNQVIRNADTRVLMTLIDRKTGKSYHMMTDLNPRGSATRLGIYVQDDYRGGVAVTGVMPRSPGYRCRYLLNDYNSGGGGETLGGGGNSNNWSRPTFHPEAGDLIISVNDIKIQNTAHYNQVIRNADTRVLLTLIDRKTGKTYYMMTDLNPRGSVTRLGIHVQDDYRGGVAVTRVVAGSPGTRCRYLMDGNIQSVRSNNNVY